MLNGPKGTTGNANGLSVVVVLADGVGNTNGPDALFPKKGFVAMLGSAVNGLGNIVDG